MIACGDPSLYIYIYITMVREYSENDSWWGHLTRTAQPSMKKIYILPF
jgi:nicotinamide mononucleotide adenylyltransferase